MDTVHKFSIFLPVRNGGHYFKQCVFSILNQTHQNFDLIILDNASTDGSLEWIQTIKDSRICIHESEKDLSIEENWERILSIPKNEFMTIIGHDDLLDTNYLDVMTQLIDKNPDAGLYQAHFRLIDAEGLSIRSCYAMPTTENADTFLESRFSFQRDSFGTGYMFRSVDYEKVGGIPSYKKLLFADDALWVMLMINSYKATAQDECFSYRIHDKSTSYAPDWYSLFDALETYLVFLKNCTKSHPDIAIFLNYKLSDYMIFWFQWAYFKNSNDKKAIKVKIYQITTLVNDILNDTRKKEFTNNINKYVFGYFAHFRRYMLRYKNRVKHISMKVKKVLIP